MSIKTNYFDGHTYSAADDRRPWYSLMDDGVFGIATQALKVVASSPADLSVNVQPGACIVAGYYIYSDAVVNLPIIANTSGYNRVDIVVVEVDEVNKETDIRIVQGTPTSTPTAPLPNEQQYVLAEIFVGNNVSVIENSNITDRRKEAMTKTLKTHLADFETHLAESSSKHITESGSNENGSYIKFDDGTMICRRTVNPDRSIVNEEQTFPYPMRFIDVPSVSASHQWGANAAYQKSCATMFLCGEVNTWRVAFTESTSIGRTQNMYLMAIGRWK